MTEADLLRENAELKEALHRNGLRIDEDGYLEYRDKERDDALERRIRELTASNAGLRDALGVARLHLLNWDSRHSYISNKYRILISIIEQALTAKEPKV